jgi:hypothetical protein
MRYDELHHEQERAARANADISYLAAFLFVVATVLVGALFGLMIWR